MADMSAVKNDVKKIVAFLEEQKAREVVAIDVSKVCSWTDAFVIATYNSQGALRGLIKEFGDFMAKEDLVYSERQKKIEINEWVLLDLDYIVVHLFSEKAREFYDLERLWFNGELLTPPRA